MRLELQRFRLIFTSLSCREAGLGSFFFFCDLLLQKTHPGQFFLGTKVLMRHDCIPNNFQIFASTQFLCKIHIFLVIWNHANWRPVQATWPILLTRQDNSPIFSRYTKFPCQIQVVANAANNRPQHKQRKLYYSRARVSTSLKDPCNNQGDNRPQRRHHLFSTASRSALNKLPQTLWELEGYAHLTRDL